ncbi:MAG: ImmA/IrrE family metallo-endopeptidase [Alicyclobacillus sp.]|nr:ImmA/IrrE family metallo-endopeptidase [Alicyclobacillus sp.]
MSHDYIKNSVLKLVRKFKTCDPYRICELKGIIIWKRILSNSIRGMYIRAFRRRYIIINSEIHWQWQRFICAHELGHDVLHKDMKGLHVDSVDMPFRGKMELEANVFAVYLLLLGQGIWEPPLPMEAIMNASVIQTTKLLAHIVRDRTGEYC